MTTEVKIGHLNVENFLMDQMIFMHEDISTVIHNAKMI